MVAKRSRPRAPTHGIHTAGKQYMAWVHSKDKVKRKETDGTLAKRAALLSQGHDAACYKQCGNEHPCLQLCAKMQQSHAAGRTSPQAVAKETYKGAAPSAVDRSAVEESANGFPLSRDSSAARPSRSCSIKSASLYIKAPRSRASIFPQGPS